MPSGYVPGADRRSYRRPAGPAAPAHDVSSRTKIPMSAASKPRTDVPASNDAGIVEMTVDVRDKKQLEKLCSAMRRISGVRDVERTNHSMTTQLTTDPEHIAVSKSKGIEIDWKDGHHSSYGVEYLCATGAPARPARARMAPSRARRRGPEAASARPFPDVQAEAQECSASSPSGNYALRISWNDGHATGIYSYDHLREICPCPQCQAPRARSA